MFQAEVPIEWMHVFYGKWAHSVPFMAVKEHRKQVNTKDTIKVVK